MQEVNSKEFRSSVGSGFTSICYSGRGESTLIGGAGGSLIENASYEGSDPFPWGDVNDDVLCIATKGKNFIVGTEDNKVILFDLSVEDDRDSSQTTLTKFQCPVRCVSFDATGTSVAAGADDSDIKILSLNNDDSDILTMTISGHENSIRSVAYDPLGEFLLSSSCDGTVRVWNLRENGEEIKKFEILEEVKDPVVADDQGVVDWHPDGSKFAVPVKNDICIYQRDSWELLCTLKDVNAHSKRVSIVKWSQGGKYLASSSVDGHVVVWDYNTNTPISSCNKTLNNNVTGLNWHPSKHKIVLANNLGEWSEWDNVIPANAYLVSKPSMDIEVTESAVVERNADSNLINNIEPSGLSEKRTSPFANTQVTTTKPTAATTDEIPNNLLDDMAEDFNGDMNDFIVNDEEEEPVQRERASSIVYEKYVNPALDVHKPFQPSSTPLPVNEEKNSRRFMCWKMLGYIVQRVHDEQSLIDIEFNDQSKRRNIHFIDQHGFSLGALGDRGAIFATSGDENNQATVYYRQHEGWATNEWYAKISKGDVVTGVGLGKNWAAVATKKRFVHLYSLSGLAVETICAPGDIVCITGENDSLCIAYTDPCAGSNVFFKLYQFKKQLALKLKASDKISLSPNSKLKWIGFSKLGALATCDSEYIVRTFNPDNGTWSLSLDCRQAYSNGSTEKKDNTFWVVDIDDIHCMAIVSRGKEYPAVIPPPFLTPLTLCPSGVDLEDENEVNYRKIRYIKNVIKSSLLKKEVFKDDEQKILKSEDTSLLKLTQIACKQDLNMRVLDLANLFNYDKAVSFSIKLAQHEKLQNLAQRLHELLQEREADDDCDEDDDKASEKTINAINKIIAKIDEISDELQAAKDGLRKQQESLEDHKQTTILDIADNKEKIDTLIASEVSGAQDYEFEGSHNEDDDLQVRGGKYNPFAKMTDPPVGSALSQSDSFFDSVQKATKIVEEKPDKIKNHSKSKGVSKKKVPTKLPKPGKPGKIIKPGKPGKAKPKSKPSGQSGMNAFVTKRTKNDIEEENLKMDNNSYDDGSDDDKNEETVDIPIRKHKKPKRTTIFDDDDDEEDDDDDLKNEIENKNDHKKTNKDDDNNTDNNNDDDDDDNDDDLEEINITKNGKYGAKQEDVSNMEAEKEVSDGVEDNADGENNTVLNKQKKVKETDNNENEVTKVSPLNTEEARDYNKENSTVIENQPNDKSSTTKSDDKKMTTANKLKQFAFAKKTKTPLVEETEKEILTENNHMEDNEELDNTDSSPQVLASAK